MLLHVVLLLSVAVGEVLWVASPNIPEAAGRYELDTEYGNIRGHPTWKSYGYVANVRTERRIALGSRCNGDVWLIGTTDAVVKNMGWLVTIEGNEGRSPDELEGWGRVLNKDWVKDSTVRVTTIGPAIPMQLFIDSPHSHLQGECTLSHSTNRGFPVWECHHACTDIHCDQRYTFTDSHGNWVLGPNYAKDTGWAMASHHGGRLPHQITEWQRQDGKGGWIVDPTVRMYDPRLNSTADDGRCSKFWVEGIDRLNNVPFVPSDTVYNFRQSYRSMDGEHVIYWCPSCFLLAGKPAWKVTSGTDLPSTSKDPPSATYPHCPGWLITEDTTGGEFASSVSITWYIYSDDVWNDVQPSLTCYDDLL